MYSSTRSEAPSSPTSPTSPIRTSSRASQMRHKTTLPTGFRPSPKPKRTPISEMTLRELQDLHNTNTRLLSSPRESTSADGQSWMVRVRDEQAAVEGRLHELGMDAKMDSISTELKNTLIKGEEDMNVDPPPPEYTNPRLEAKRKALSRFGGISDPNTHSMSMQEAIELEQRAHRDDKERQERALERKKRMGMAIPGEQLTREEREARVWAFMNYKPTDSDLEADSDEDEDDEDPASWFVDDDDDNGRKGQLIVEPDEEDYTDIIRIDSSKMPYNMFYEPHD